MANAQIKAVITAEDRASGVLHGFSSSVEKVGDKVVSSMKTAAVAFGAASVAATTFAVKSAADFEQTRIGLENMLGSADAARAMLSKVSKFAAETPFEFPELAQATRQLVAFGFSGEDAFKTMTQLGDVAAAIGAPINDLAYLMGTLRAQGRAFTIDIRQFAMRGIPIYEYLAKVFKTNTQEVAKLIEAGKVGFPEVQKAFEMMTAEGGKFHGTMVKQSKSLTGLFSTLKDVIGSTARELVGITQEGDIKAGSLFDKLRQGTARLIETLPTVIEQMKQIVGQVVEIVKGVIPQLKQWADNIVDVGNKIVEYLQPKLQALFDTVKESLPTYKEFWNDVLVPLAVVIGTTLVVAIGFAIDAFNFLLEAAKPVISWLSDNEWVFWSLVAVLGAVKVALMLQGALAAFQGVMAGVAASYSGVVALLSVPIVLPALAIGAVLGSIALMYSEYLRTKNAIDQLSGAIQGRVNSDIAVVQRLQGLINSGTNEQWARAVNTAAGLGLKITGAPAQFATGGFTGQGGSNEVAGIVHKGEYVLPQNMVNQSTGTPKIGETINISINAGAFMGSQQDARRYAKYIMDAYKDLMSAQGVV